MSNYKLGLCSISFRNNTPEEILSAMKEAGLSYVEWGSDVHAPKDDTEKINEIVKLQKEYGIECSSYGTYFHLGINPIDELEDYINAAKILGTNKLRLWCGKKNSEEYSAEQKEVLFNECRAAAKIAEKHNVTLCLECHNWTYTNNKDSASELMKTVNSENFRMYWQPSQFEDEQENLKYAKLVAPYTVNIHVFNWKGAERYPLCTGAESWKQYLSNFAGEHTLLLEFMPDNKLETLSAEAATLKEITK